MNSVDFFSLQFRVSSNSEIFSHYTHTLKLMKWHCIFHIKISLLNIFTMHSEYFIPHNSDFSDCDYFKYS